MVNLREPTARQYAEFRVMMREADVLVRDKFVEPRPPVLTDDMAPDEVARMVGEYQEAAATWNHDRRDFLKDPEHGPYALIVISVVERLGDRKVTLDDLTAEAFNVSTCSAMLGVWEAPLGGPAAPASPGPAATPTAAPSVPDASPVASTASEGSSPPGTDTATPSPQPPSTG